MENEVVISEIVSESNQAHSNQKTETCIQIHSSQPIKSSSINTTVDKNSKIVAIIPHNNLSMFEQHFIKQNILMVFSLTITTPKGLSSFSKRNISDIIKKTAASHYRLSATVKEDLFTELPYHTADELNNLNIQFCNSNDVKDTFIGSLNYNFAEHLENKYLWRALVLLNEDDLQQWNIDSQITFTVCWTIHHCLGDGLSMFALARTFVNNCTYDNLEGNTNLSRVEIDKSPPPLMDNLFNPWFIETIPALYEMLWSFVKRKVFTVMRGRDVGSLKNFTPSTTNLLESSAGTELTRTSTNPASIHNNGENKTNAKFLWFQKDFITKLRTKCKVERTSIAAVLVVAALCASKTCGEKMEKYKLKGVPNRQGWVVTNSLRHLIPGSKLIEGADKETDPATAIFGSYAGSISDPALNLKDTKNFWLTCQKVKRDINKIHFSSIARLKLSNYIYRKPSLFKFMQSKVDLKAFTRLHSVEIANLGAWSTPESDIIINDIKGLVNCNFDGSRALFTLGVITVGGEMSISIGYCEEAIYEEDAILFTH
ncbi:hypothetical protein HK099_003783, partial [Clydaea vesicula]